MEDKLNNQTLSKDTSTFDDKEDLKGGKTFTQEDLDNLASKIRAEEKRKSEALIREAVANELSEVERLAKLTSEEKLQEENTKRQEDFNKREYDLKLREMTLLAREKLQEKHLSEDMVTFIVDTDETTLDDNISKFEKAFNKAVENSVTNRLKGTPPEDFTNDNKDKPTKKIMSAF